MSYSKQTWAYGDDITAAKLNHIEDGIEAVDSTAYTKPAGGIPSTDLASAVQSALAPEIFWATYGTTTNAEIMEAYNAGKLVMCKYNSAFYMMVVRSSNTRQIFSLLTPGQALYGIECNANTWTNTNVKLAILASPAFTGNPTAPTQATSDNSTKIATTAFVKAYVDSLDANSTEY